MEKKKKSLANLFLLIFILSAIGMIIVNETMTYMAQTRSYHEECASDLRKLTTFLTSIIESEGDEFLLLKSWYKEHPDQVEVPLNFREELPNMQKAFDDYVLENYPGKIYGANLSFDELDFEGQKLFVNYSFAYWFTVFFDATDKFGLSYVYFIYPENEAELTMNYMFDPALETTTTADGKEILKLGYIVYEDPTLHQFMWSAWNSGQASNGFDSIDNEFGHVYTYCVPLIIKGEKVGLLCSEISIEFVNSEIRQNVIAQGLVTAIVLIVFTIVLYILLDRNVLKRILRIENGVKKYSEEKDPEIAKEIINYAGRMDELGILATSFGDMIKELDDYMINLQHLTAEKERIGAELNVATQIQADMLPRIFPPFPDVDQFDLYASMNPAKEVGGDFYDFFMIGKDKLGLVVADVSGKGVPAALFMVIAKTLIKNRAQMGGSPSEILAYANEQLCEGNEAELFVTVWIAIVDINTGKGLAANAGHEHPALRRAGGEFELVMYKHSPAVATMEGLKFKEHEFELHPGDTLMCYTDGVTEATNKDNELFGNDRLLAALNKNPDADCPEVIENVKADIEAFVGDAPQFDDITMLAVKFI